MPPKWKKKICLSKQSRPGTGRLFKLLSTRRTHSERMCRTQSRKLKAARRRRQRAAICPAGVRVPTPPTASAAPCPLPHCVWGSGAHDMNARRLISSEKWAKNEMKQCLSMSATEIEIQRGSEKGRQRDPAWKKIVANFNFSFSLLTFLMGIFRWVNVLLG